MATQRVGGTVTCLTASRDGDSIKVEWKNPSYLFDETREDCATWLDSNIDFHRENCAVTSGQVWAHAGDLPPEGAKLLEYTGFDYNWVKGISQETSYVKPYDRNRFHPVQDGKYCRSVQVRVHGGNDSGVGGWDPDSRSASGRGPDAVFNYSFEQPPAPKAEWTGLDEDENYALRYKIDCRPGDEPDGTAASEVYDTVFTIYRQDNIPGSGYAVRKALVSGVVRYEGDDTANSIATLPNLLALDFGQWVEYTIDCRNRGIWGDGPRHALSYVISWPARASITGAAVSSTDRTTGIITVSTRTPSNGRQRTTRAKLQRLRNVDPALTADDLNSDDYQWADVTGMVEIDERYRDATWSTGFVDSVASAAPSGPNLRTWYRVVTENEVFNGANSVKSPPFECVQLYREQTAADDVVFIESLAANSDATAVKALLAWEDAVDSSGIEVSWSDKPDAWESSEQPSVAQVTWEDPQNKGSHDKSAHFTIYGVEQGQELYVKARWYHLGSDGDVDSYGAYATPSQFPFVPAMPPRDVRLTAPAYLTRGEDVPLTWTFRSDAPQTAWVVYLVEYEGGSESSREAVASGEDAYGACTVPNAMMPDGGMLVVSVTTGSSWAESEPQQVRFADAPVVSAVLPSRDADGELPVILGQPVTVYCSSETGDDRLRVRVVSRGITVSLPDGKADQLPGDVVFDAYVDPEWAESDGAYYTAVTLPGGLDLNDVGVYDFEVTGVSQTTGLASETQTVAGRVRWAHQAHQPGPASSVTPYAGDRVCVITPEEPDNAGDSDVFDLYRVTPDGADLIARGLPFGSEVSDRYAPFGRGPLMYRICTRTPDGDVSWRDVHYEMPCGSIRLDWGEEHLELPYNIVRGESATKDFERRSHLDGGVGGGWNPAVTRDWSLAADIFKLGSAEEQRLVRSLASHAGPVFVRLPNGTARQANVDLSGLDESYESGAVHVSLAAAAVGLTDEFMVSASEVSYPEPPEERGSTTREQVAYWGGEQPAEGDSYALLYDAPEAAARLSTSCDGYTNEWAVAASVSGGEAVLGEFSAELAAYLSEVPDGSLYLVTLQMEVPNA